MTWTSADTNAERAAAQYRDTRTPEPHMRALADFLDYVILNSERQT